MNGSLVLARAGENGPMSQEERSARSASLPLDSLDEDLAAGSTMTVAPARAPSTRSGDAGAVSTTRAPKASTATTTTTTVVVATTPTTVKPAGGVVGPGLYVVAPDGTGVRRLVAGYGMHSWSPDGSRLAWSNAIAPTWSSDGRLAVIGTKTIEPGTLLHLTLQLVEPGGGLRMVFDAGDGFSVQSPAWSPTGRLLAVSVGTERLSGLVSR